MASNLAIPFNIYILVLTPAKLAGLKPIRALDIFDGATGNFHEDGLFSPSIFGKVGDELRQKRFSYIDIKLQIFHPVIYRALAALKGLYEEIMTGSSYAVWNSEISDFERSDAVNGQTGYNFFVKYWERIQFQQTGSTQREQLIMVIEKNKDNALLSKVVAMPAGLRDVEIGANGRVTEDEINNSYRKLLSIANTINDSVVKTNPDLLNVSRISLQRTFNEVYANIESRLEGKHKLILGKWASRRIMNGTRNVITAMQTNVGYLGGPGTISFNHTIVGLYQAMKAVMPMARYRIRNGFLSKVFTSPELPAKLVNKKTLSAEMVELNSQYFERYATDEGIEKIITAFNEEELRDKPIEIEGRYLGLVYKGPDGTFKVIQDIAELPPNRSAKDVSPITFCQLLYISTYTDINRYPMLITRYPVTGVGSIYPSTTYVKTTVKAEVRKELNEQWEPMGDDHVAYQFPTIGPYVNSVSPHSSRLGGLGADFDGDMVSANAAYSNESIAEVTEYFKKKSAYVGTNGRFSSSVGNNTINLVLFNLTGD
jgi:hypothetical protein